MNQSLILITLLVKMGAAAAIASALVRSLEFKKLLFKEERDLARKIQLVLWIGSPIALGSMVRVFVHNFLAADLSFEGAIVIGLIGGRVCGAMGGVLVGFPALLHGEWLALPFYVLCAVAAGGLRQLARDREAIWSFSPFVDLSVYRWMRRYFPRPQLDWQLALFCSVLAMRAVQQVLGRWPHLTEPRWPPVRIFALDSSTWWVVMLIYFSSVLAVGIMLKIWNNTRNELKLEEQERMLLHARMDALQSQINPHFLFNTLNTVSSLVRFDPEKAREVIVKLANILRRLLRKADAFVPLREEMEFIDDYLDIEVVRFGRDKLRVQKELDPASLDVLVPHMLLQPLVENSIKHGLAPKIDGGSILLRSRVTDSMLFIEVEDDGVGMGSAQLLQPPTGLGGTGIGMANVAERLKVLYGDGARMIVDSRHGLGTSVKLEIPILHAAGVPSARYEARSMTQR
jgi:two-component system LytT family sensor kinase